jgi:large subunit ribosomal protein L22
LPQRGSSAVTGQTGPVQSARTDMTIARSKNIGVSPLKMRLVIDQVRGKSVAAAESALMYMTSPAAEVVLRTVRSAAANAENNDLLNRDDLKIVRITADQGPVLKRYQPKARGRAGSKDRPSCHLTIEVAEARSN